MLKTFREIIVRPMTDSGMSKLENWFKNQNWEQILMVDCVNKKVENLQSMVYSKVEQFLPLKNRKIAVDDQPWYTEELKNLKRKKSREYSKNRKSEKYLMLNKKYDEELKVAKRKYKRKAIDDVLTSSERQWYSKLKKLPILIKKNWNQYRLKQLKIFKIKYRLI